MPIARYVRGKKFAAALAAVAWCFALVAGPAHAADAVRVGGTGSAVGTMRVLAEAFHAGEQDDRVAIRVSGLGARARSALRHRTAAPS